MAEQAKEGGSTFSPIRARAVILGFLLCLPATYAVTNQGVSNIFSLMVQPVSALIFLALANVFLRRISPRLAFNQADFIVVFSIVSVASAMSGEWAGITQNATYNYPLQARTNDTFKNQLSKYVPDWLAIKDLEKVKDIEGGGKDVAYVIRKVPMFLPVWLGWAVGMLGTCFAMLCINSLMRGAWNERERLTFPLIQLPVAMSEDGGRGGMWRS
jgi:hypothetical protein